MPRKPVKTRIRPQETLPEYLYKFLISGKQPKPDGEGAWEIFDIAYNRDNLKKTWNIHKRKILKSWIETKPGTRPWAFWECEPPVKLRRRIRGKDIPEETPGFEPGHEFGIPENADEKDFESEYEFLKRYGFLTKTEENRLK